MMGTDLSGVRAGLAARAEAAGFRVARDPATSRPPTVLVGPVTDVVKDTGCLWTVTVPVYLIHPRPAVGRVADAMAAEIGRLLDALGETQASLGTYDTGTGGDLPAYEITTTTVTEGD
jgi:hypothetical protein